MNIYVKIKWKDKIIIAIKKSHTLKKIVMRIKNKHLQMMMMMTNNLAKVKKSVIFKKRIISYISLSK